MEYDITTFPTMTFGLLLNPTMSMVVLSIFPFSYFIVHRVDKIFMFTESLVLSVSFFRNTFLWLDKWLECHNVGNANLPHVVEWKKYLDDPKIWNQILALLRSWPLEPAFFWLPWYHIHWWILHVASSTSFCSILSSFTCCSLSFPRNLFSGVPAIFIYWEELLEKIYFDQLFFFPFELPIIFDHMTLIIVEITEFSVISILKVIYNLIRPLNLVLTFQTLNHLSWDGLRSQVLKGSKTFSLPLLCP